MSVIDNNGKRILEPGDFAVSIGGQQPSLIGRTEAVATNIVSATITFAGKILEIPEK